MIWYPIESIVLFSLASAALNVPIRRQESPRPRFDRHHHLAERSTSVLELANLITYYEVTLEIGTPEQEVVFTIDTGSSDLWVMAASNPYCDSQSPNAPNCSTAIVFDYHESTTFSMDDSSDFKIQYGDKTFASGHYARDVVRVGSILANDAMFALALESNSTEAVFGIGPKYGETYATQLPPGGVVGPTYQNIPEALKEQGQIQRVAYSIWLNDPDAGDGSLLMGGIDHAKYRGRIGIVPMVDGSGKNFTYPRLPWVMLHEVFGYKRNEMGLIAQLAQPVLIDSGTTLVYLPQKLVDSLGQVIGGTYSSKDSTYLLPCDITKLPIEGFILRFSGVDVEFPLPGALIRLYDDNGAPTLDKDGNPQCAFAISPSDYCILGDIFLRNVYAVFDNESFEVGFANARLNATDSDIEEMSTGIIGTQAPSYSSTIASSSIKIQQLLMTPTGQASGSAHSSTLTSEAASTTVGTSGTAIAVSTPLADSSTSTSSIYRSETYSTGSSSIATASSAYVPSTSSLAQSSSVPETKTTSRSATSQKNGVTGHQLSRVGVFIAFLAAHL